ncbi:hypothetical protein JL720_1076 [Aureococcus anophagefferens]|nr:hypothetical protein JL720_1076 [Aureococcus anophagefferens]
MRREDSFDVACAHYRSAPELFNDEERLHLYALYKQATAGRAPGHNAAVPRMALLRSAPLEGASREELVDLVSALRDKVTTLRVGQVMKAGELARYRETMTGGDWSFRYFQGSKESEIPNFKGSYLGRYFEVVPGMLRCYRSKTIRDLRLEVPLTAGVAVFPEAVKLTRRSGARFVFRVRLAEPIACASRIVEVRCSAASKEELDDWIAALEASKAMGGGVDEDFEEEGPSAAAAAPAAPAPSSEPPRSEARDATSRRLLSRTVHRRSRAGVFPRGFGRSERRSRETRRESPFRAEGVETRRSSQNNVGNASQVAAEPPVDGLGGGAVPAAVNLVAIVAIVSSAGPAQRVARHPLVAAASDWYRGAGGTAVSARDLTLDLLFRRRRWSLGAVVACAAAALLVERVAAQVHRYDALWHGLRAACVVATLALPLYCVSLAPVRPGTHAAILLNGCVAMMKMLSYAHTNAELRRRYAARARAASARRRRATGATSSFGPRRASIDRVGCSDHLAASPHGVFVSNEYPANLTAGDLARFFAFPTLVRIPSVVFLSRNRPPPLGLPGGVPAGAAACGGAGS